MKVTITKTIGFTLDLEENEAHYLRALLQNYLGDAKAEPIEERTIRCHLFTELNEAIQEVESC